MYCGNIKLDFAIPFPSSPPSSSSSLCSFLYLPLFLNLPQLFPLKRGHCMYLASLSHCTLPWAASTVRCFSLESSPTNYYNYSAGRSSYFSIPAVASLFFSRFLYPSQHLFEPPFLPFLSSVLSLWPLIFLLGILSGDGPYGWHQTSTAALLSLSTTSTPMTLVYLIVTTFIAYSIAYLTRVQ